MICTKCVKVLQHTTRQNPILRNDVPSEGVSQNAKSYCEDRPDLLQSLAYSCWICTKLARWIASHMPRRRRKNRTEPFLVEYECVMLAFAPGIDHILVRVTMKMLNAESQETCEIEVQLFRPSGNGPFPSFCLTSPILLNVTMTVSDHFINDHVRNSKNSRDGFNAVSDWMNECQLRHEKCKQNRTNLYPSRLLYLGKAGNDIKLVITAMQRPRSPYLTLSHRWGSEEYTKLQSSTIDELLRRINLSMLSLTFQDAVEVTRRLGFHYLWIDSLCILQGEDDVSDWLRESSEMGKIYSNAVLNLSATGTPDSSTSMFHDRDLETLVPSTIEIEVNSTMQQSHLYDGDIWNDEITNAHLNFRAWVFQERMLARRVLHFGRNQLAWECRELDAMELFPCGHPHKTYGTLLKQDVGSIMAESDREVSPERNRRAFSLWREMVTIYSGCSLTKPEDKLIALSGIAEHLRHVTCDEYMAGMWRRTMAFDLPWWRDTELRDSLPRSRVEYRAPSWSWASVEGTITFPQMSGGFYEPLINVVEANLAYLNDQDVTGGLVGGSIKIRCRPHTLFLGELEEDGSFSALTISGRILDITRDESSRFLSPEMSYQELKDHNRRHELYCVASRATKEELCGIVLENCKPDTFYHRVGSFVVDTSGAHYREVREEEKEERMAAAAATEAVMYYLKDTSRNEDSVTSEDDASGAASHDKEGVARYRLEAIANALRTDFEGRDSLPCDFYDDESGQHIVTIL